MVHPESSAGHRRATRGPWSRHALWFRFLQPHWKALALAFGAALVETVSDVLDPWPVKVVIDSVLLSKPLSGPLGAFVLRTFGASRLSILNFAVTAVLAIATIGAVSAYAEKYLITTVGQWMTHDLRRTVYNHIQRLSLSEYDRTRTGDLITRVTGDIEAIQDFITSALLGMIVNILTLVGMIGVMTYVNWRFTLIALSIAPVLFMLLYFFTRRIKQASRAVRQQASELASVVEEAVSSARVVKAFAREDFEARRFASESLRNVEAALRARSLKAKLSPLVEVVVALGTCLVLGYGGRLALAGELSAGVLMVFLLYLSRMYKPMRELSKMTDTVSKALVGYERIAEVWHIESQVRDQRGAKRAPRLHGRIEFDRVSFSYDGQQPVLQDICFRIEPGQVAAIVGPSGTGKTTIVNLIARFYDPVSGHVTIDGTDIRRFTQKSLRDQIGFVLQDTLLFHASIADNIAYGKPEASRREIIEAARLANSDEFIERLPDGYDTVVGERGQTLSGGQRQRLAIARAMIRNAPILVLDEPTTGLDVQSERAVLDAVGQLMKGHTSIVIAHDLDTIRRADVIFVIQDAELVEHGTHEELLRGHGVYRRLYDTQTGKRHPRGEERREERRRVYR